MALEINITDRAAKQVRNFAENEGMDKFGLRVAVKGGGCSGLTYVLSIDKEALPDDRVVEDHGIKIFIPKKSYVFLAGTTLEYSDGLNGNCLLYTSPSPRD